MESENVESSVLSLSLCLSLMLEIYGGLLQAHW